MWSYWRKVVAWQPGGALGVSFVEHAALAGGGEAASGAGVDGLAFVVVEQQRHERLREEGGDGVVGQGCAVGEGVAVGPHVHHDLRGDGSRRHR
jgi:hypothetical protein